MKKAMVVLLLLLVTLRVVFHFSVSMQTGRKLSRASFSWPLSCLMLYPKNGIRKAEDSHSW